MNFQPTRCPKKKKEPRRKSPTFPEWGQQVPPAECEKCLAWPASVACALPALGRNCVLTCSAARSLPIARNECQTAVCEWVMVLPHHFKVDVFHYFFYFFFNRDVERDDFSPLKTAAAEKLMKGAVFETPGGLMLPPPALL